MPRHLLHEAAEEGNLSRVRALLKAPNCDVNEWDANEFTPLHWAAFKGHERVVRELLHQGADWQALNTQGKSPVHLASRGGHPHIVSILNEWERVAALQARRRRKQQDDENEDDTTPAGRGRAKPKPVVRVLSREKRRQQPREPDEGDLEEFAEDVAFVASLRGVDPLASPPHSPRDQQPSPPSSPPTNIPEETVDSKDVDGSCSPPIAVEPAEIESLKPRGVVHPLRRPIKVESTSIPEVVKPPVKVESTPIPEVAKSPPARPMKVESPEVVKSLQVQKFSPPSCNEDRFTSLKKEVDKILAGMMDSRTKEETIERWRREEEDRLAEERAVFRKWQDAERGKLRHAWEEVEQRRIEVDQLLEVLRNQSHT